LGERAGNAALEEIVMAIKTRGDYFPVETTIDTSHIVATSRLVSTITGFPVQPNKAIVGANAFAHESGIHQDGILKHRETYEIMRAEDVGWNTNKLVLGKLSGRAAFKSRLEDLGITFDSQEALDSAFERFKILADKKTEIFDEDLQALVSDVSPAHANDKYQLVAMEAHSQMDGKPNARVKLTISGHEEAVTAEGGGPVDAAFKAIEKVARSGADLKLYSVNAITSGTDSQGEVTVRLEKSGVIVNGSGADTDIVVASVKAYLHALNLLDTGANKEHPQQGV
jgi:2-isopropylmalate synthase